MGRVGAGSRVSTGLTAVVSATIFAALFVAVLAAGPGRADAAQPNAAVSAAGAQVKVQLLTRSQGQISSGARAKLTLGTRGNTPATAKVRVEIEVRQAWSKWARFGTRTVTVNNRRPATVKVKLNRSARSIALGCGRPSLRLKATYRSAGRKRATSRTARLSLQGSRCAVPREVDLSRAASCDFIAAAGNPCIAPFPNDFYTRADPTSETGLRVDLAPDSTPISRFNNGNIDVTELNQSDGFSPGQSISVQIPGMDNQPAFDQTGIVPITDMSATYAPEQPVLLIDARTGERQLIWGELDSNATQDQWRNLIVRPGKNLVEGRRYIVALRNMKDADGNLLEAPAGFRLYRDTIRTLKPVIEKRRAGFESVFRTLSREGVSRRSLYMAWDFTVASTENITGRMLSIRDRAFADLGDTDLADSVVQGDSPDFQITEVIDYPTPTGDGVENIRTVNGTFTVPCYLNRVGCGSGSTFDLDANQIPIRIPGNEMTARFTCNIPRSAINGSGGVIEPVRPSLYGHGLFGQYTETNTRNVRQLGTENGVMTCGTDWSGMASEDVLLAALPALQDLSKFPALPDRLQQGFLNFLFLGRLMIHNQGFAADAAFRFNGETVIDTRDLFYYGNSQGGIAGGALTAIAPDFTRSVLYVPGMNYSTLLTRAQPFDIYSRVLYPSYRNEIERPLIFSLMQVMWDRGEPNGYANHMTSDPLPNTPPHKVMIEMAYGDHQVANIATEVQARTIGAPLKAPALDTNRLSNGMIEPFFGLDTLGDLAGPAADGNAFFIWDTGPKRGTAPNILGTDPPPNGNIPPPSSSGADPHDTVINASPLIRKQIADFLTTGGKVTNPCGLNPCYAAGWNGFP